MEQELAEIQLEDALELASTELERKNAEEAAKEQERLAKEKEDKAVADIKEMLNGWEAWEDRELVPWHMRVAQLKPMFDAWVNQGEALKVAAEEENAAADLD